MDDLMPRLEPETGQVILEGLPAGAAGEAPLVPVSGLDLAFDRVDGRLCRAVVAAAGPGGPVVPDEQVAAMLIRLFGPDAPSVIFSAPAAGTRVLRPEPELTGTLSSLARLDAAQATSPVPPGSPWWAAEATGLAERAGLPARACAYLNATGPPPLVPALDVAAEVRSLEKDRVRLAGPQWMLDPGLVPGGLFRLGLSPYSDLLVRHEHAAQRVIVEARLVPGADCAALGRCQVRLVDPPVRRILARAPLTKAEPGPAAAKTGALVWSELQLSFPLDELPEPWIEVVQDQRCGVRGARGRRIRRALRWADAALRAERAPAGLAPESPPEDWAALAAAAWERCRRDWEAAADADRAYLAARRQAAVDPRTCVPPPPSDTAAEIARQVPVDGPAYLAETRT
jgi:hypothetical protein